MYRLGTLGEPKTSRLAESLYEETRLRNRAAILCGITIGALLVWSQFAVLWIACGK